MAEFNKKLRKLEDTHQKIKDDVKKAKEAAAQAKSGQAPESASEQPLDQESPALKAFNLEFGSTQTLVRLLLIRVSALAYAVVGVMHAQMNGERV